MRLYSLCAAALLAASATASQAAFNLQITEIWSGQAPTPNITDDWFEVTNYGDMAWTSGIDADLYVDDSSANMGSTAAVRLISGLTSIEPGQSVIVLMEGELSDAEAFNAAWGISGVAVGYSNGSGLGLGAGGDSVNLFLASPAPGYTLLDNASYAARTGDYSQSWDELLGEWSTIGNASGAFASVALGGTNGDVAAVGSPGRVPEPSTVALVGLAALGLLAARKRLV